MLKVLLALCLVVGIVYANKIEGSVESAAAEAAAAPADAVSDFATLSAKFGEFHKDKVNILLHLITTPLGFIGAFCLVSRITKSGGFLPVVAALYVASLVPVADLAVVLGTAGLLAVTLYLAHKANMSVLVSLVTIVVAWVGQDAAHYITGEKTYFGDYSSLGATTAFAAMFYEHVYFLLPLCVDVALPASVSLITPPLLVETAENGVLHLILVLVFIVLGNYKIDSTSGWFPWNYRKARGLFCNLSSAKSRGDLALIREWVLAQSPAQDRTSHWWQVRLEKSLKDAFSRVALSPEIMKMFNSKFDQNDYSLDVLEGMNEIYVSVTQAKGTSDEVFFTRHVDGPWGLFPFGSCYRCIVGLDPNQHFTTHLPHTPASYTVSTGDALAFDFNREVHYITCDPSKIDETRTDQFRVILKIHYCVYPKNLWLLGKILGALNIFYNMCFRALFLATIKPKTAWDRLMAHQVVFQTKVVEGLQTHVGFANIAYFAVMAFIGHTYDYRIFIVMTSFMHYYRYITTYYNRKDVDYVAFKRDAFLFKAVSLAQLLLQYAFYLDISALQDIDYVSLAIMAFGFSVSSLATLALGMDRTYFGVELGFYKPKWVTQFPYGVIPHPMIVGQCFALAGMYLNERFRTAWPFLIPMHILLYVTHMLQEVFDIHERQPHDPNAKKLD